MQEANVPFPVGLVVKVGTRVKFVGTITHAYDDGTYDIVYQVRCFPLTIARWRVCRLIACWAM